MRATLEHEGTDEDWERLGLPPALVGSEPLVVDLYWRLRRSTPAELAVSIDTALRLHELMIGELAEPVRFLEEIEAMDAEFLAQRTDQVERKTRAERAKEKSDPSRRPGF